MDVHQRIAGALVGVFGAGALLGWATLLLPHVGPHPIQALRDLTSTFWSTVFLIFLVLGLLWCLLAMLGGWRAWRQRPDARRPLLLAALPLLLVFPLGTAAGAYTLWAFWRVGAWPPASEGRQPVDLDRPR